MSCGGGGAKRRETAAHIGPHFLSLSFLLTALCSSASSPQDPIRLFEGNAILRRLVRIGVLDEDRMKLDYVLCF